MWQKRLNTYKKRYKKFKCCRMTIAKEDWKIFLFSLMPCSDNPTLARWVWFRLASHMLVDKKADGRRFKTGSEKINRLTRIATCTLPLMRCSRQVTISYRQQWQLASITTLLLNLTQSLCKLWKINNFKDILKIFTGTNKAFVLVPTGKGQTGKK